jgi:hypothetical protein
MRREPAENTFELGLVMAGAVSAGAYTAGVLDFLFEALGQWEEAKREGQSAIPDHTVQIRVVTGTSAGGIAAGLTAMLPFTGHHPVRDLDQANKPEAPVNAAQNLLYRSWVKDIDLTTMLDKSDIGPATVPSLLNGHTISAVADNAIATVRQAGGDGRRGYFANPLQLYLCLTNLRGVPYLIHMIAEDGVRGHRVTTHGDYAHFAVFRTNHGQPEGLPPGAAAVNWPGTTEPDDGWDRLKAAALATSAFPVGLPARRFSNDLRLYEAKLWRRPAGVSGDVPPPRVAPDAPPHLMQPLDFWSLDGGLVDNEPLELARVALSGGPDIHNERDPTRADRAVLMIDPFPDDEGQILPALGQEPDMLASALSLIPTLKTHARFKPGEIVLALHEDIYSRFLIAPRRHKQNANDTDLASAGLGGFAGFVDAAFRMHDFQLGRRNCQKFLMDRFVIHRDNPIVGGWVRRLEGLGQLTEHHPKFRTPSGGEMTDTSYVRLIPLCGSAVDPVQARRWPRLDWRVVHDRLKRPLQARVEAITPALIGRAFELAGIKDRPLVGRLLRTVAIRKLRSAILERALDSIREDLRRRSLLG